MRAFNLVILGRVYAARDHKKKLQNCVHAKGWVILTNNSRGSLTLVSGRMKTPGQGVVCSTNWHPHQMPATTLRLRTYLRMRAQPGPPPYIFTQCTDDLFAKKDES